MVGEQTPSRLSKLEDRDKEDLVNREGSPQKEVV